MGAKCVEQTSVMGGTLYEFAVTPQFFCYHWKCRWKQSRKQCSMYKEI